MDSPDQGIGSTATRAAVGVWILGRLRQIPHGLADGTRVIDGLGRGGEALLQLVAHEHEISIGGLRAAKATYRLVDP